VWFGVSILLSGVTAGAIAWTTSSGATRWRHQMESVQRFVGRRFADVWDDPAARAALAREFPRELGVNVTLADAHGTEVGSFDERCERPDGRAAVMRDGRRLGEVRFCFAETPHQGPLPILAGLAAFGLVLWMAAGFVARRLTRPLEQIVRVARDIGEGKLSTRMRLGRHATGELHELALAINEMAARIEKQLEDQKELLAAVSHEIRTPLGHARVLLEMARDGGTDPKIADELEREVLEVDTLVDQLLASSRLEFDTIDPRPLDLGDVARRALERAGLSPSLLELAGAVEVEADATLLARALGNLVDNAKEHGGGVARVRVRLDGDQARMEVEDDGPGFSPDDLERVFDRFYRGERRAGAKHGSLGLGLSLVRRIARAHGGDAFAENREGGGARVGLTIAQEPPAPAEPA
jgi:signal transduction histidine kinase